MYFSLCNFCCGICCTYRRDAQSQGVKIVTQNMEVLTFLYDGYDCQITSLYEVGRSSIATQLGALVLDYVSKKDRYPVSFQNRMLIGSIFCKYLEMYGINPRRGIFDDLVL